MYSSTDVPGAITGMVQTVMGYPPGHPLHAQAVQILTDHNTMAADHGQQPHTTGRATPCVPPLPSRASRRGRWELAFKED